MCIKTKLSCVRGENAWRFPVSSGLLGFVLGISCFGVAMKLSEYKDSPSLPPILAAIPMLGAGITGMVGGRMRKHWLISLHMALCLVAGVFGIHLMFLFLGREADSRNIHKAKCLSNFRGSHFCHRYATTIAMSGLSVLAITLAPLGIISYVVIRRMSAYNVNEVQEANNPAYERHPERESSPRRTKEEHLPQLLQQNGDRVTNHTRKAEARPQDHRQLHHKNYHHDNARPPPSHRQAYDNRNRRDLIRYNREIYQQRNEFQVSRAPREIYQQRNFQVNRAPQEIFQQRNVQVSRAPQEIYQQRNEFQVSREPREIYQQRNVEVSRAPQEISQQRNMIEVSRAPREINQQRNFQVSRAPREINQQRNFQVSRASREINQQRNMFQVSRAPPTRLGQSHVPSAGQRVGPGLSNATDASFA